MRNLILSIVTLGLGAEILMADTRLAAIQNQAGNLQRESAAIGKLAREKSADINALREKVANTKNDVEKLRELVAEFEASNPNLSEAQKKEWEKVKTAVELAAIFHERKSEAAGGTLDSKEGRRWIRAHADALALRAAKVAEFVEQMQRQGAVNR